MSSQTEEAGARVALLTEQEACKRAEALGIPDALARLHIFRVLLRSGPLAQAMSELLLGLLFRGSLDHRLRELVIMRLGWATRCDYEWTQHWRIALEQFGCSESDLLGVRDWRSVQHFGEAERAVLAATDETLAHGSVSEETFARCLEHVGDEVACIELIGAISTWRSISQIVKSLDIPLEVGVTPWPPDGHPGAA